MFTNDSIYEMIKTAKNNYDKNMYMSDCSEYTLENSVPIR